MPSFEHDTPEHVSPEVDGPVRDVDDLPHRAARQAFPVVVAQPGPVWAARATPASAAASAARALFAHVNPVVPASYAKVVCPPLPAVFPAALLDAPGAVPLGVELAESVTNGWPLFLQGAALGVGASTLCAAYADAFNGAAHAEGDPRRVLYVQLLPEIRTVRHLIDALAVAMGAPLTNAEIRFRSHNYLALRLLATAAQLRIVAIMLDPVHNLAPAARGVIAALVQTLDPAYHVPLHGDPTRPRFPRIGLVLVDHLAPEDVLGAHPAAVGLLAGRHAVLRPYTTVEQIGQALELANIGIATGTFDPGCEDDRAMAERVLELTSGLAVQLNPFLARLGLIARTLEGRPNATMVEAVLPYHRQMLELVERIGDTADNRDYLTRVVGRRTSKQRWLKAGSSDAAHEEARRVATTAADAADATDDDSAEDGSDGRGRDANSQDGSGSARVGHRGRGRAGPGPKRTRAKVLAAKRGEREQADRVARAMKRRGHTNP